LVNLSCGVCIAPADREGMNEYRFGRWFVRAIAHSFLGDDMKPFGGRPASIRTRLSGAFLRDFLADWEANGATAIKIVRQRDPSTYLRVAASILPRELMVEQVTTGMSAEERVEMLAALKQELLSRQPPPLLIEAKVNGYTRAGLREAEGTDLGS